MFTAFIPARGGSRGVRHKNLQRVDGISLVGRALINALQTPEIERIAISTDSLDVEGEVFEVLCTVFPLSKGDGPELRILGLFEGKELLLHKRQSVHASDSSLTIEGVLDYLLHEKTLLNPSTEIILLQPTSPFRDSFETSSIIRQFLEDSSLPLASVKRIESPHPLKVFEITSGNMPKLDANLIKVLSTPRQVLNSKYAFDGAYYLAKTDHLKQASSFLDQAMRVVVRNGLKTLNIDTWEDLQFAQFICDRGLLSHI